MHKLIKYSSPNYENRISSIEFLVFHYTDQNLENSLNLLTNRFSKKPVSCHYLIDESGVIYYMVDEKKCAWHAGTSKWKNIEGLNQYSIGIELVNFPNKPFTNAQMNSLKDLSLDIIKRYSIKPQNILGHSDIAPARKEDPGHLFNWEWLSKNGVGVYPKLPLASKTDQLSVEVVQVNLNKYGYDVCLTKVFDFQTKKVLKAFQSHFRSVKVDGYIDVETASIIQYLVSNYSM